MAGQATARRGAGQARKSGPSGPRRPGRGRLRLPLRPRALLILAAVVVLGAAATWVLYGSTWLRVERVKTTGTEVLSTAEVEAAAKVPVGSPLVSVDTGAIEARLLHALPRIDSVDVGRSWPHGITLEVTERKPVLLMRKGAKFVEVDAKGVRFATVAKAPAGVPLLELNPDNSPSLRRFPVDALLREAVKVTGELPAPVAKDTRLVRVTSYDAVSLELSRGRTVLWGSDEDGELKARTLVALMKAAARARYFDVSAPTAPAVSGS
ncbi:FtsQ-type POTRA domain-containing protein [Streptomyces sp. CBMA152]|uniref:cell division protein FtsQ/DivIB n=1 Tax=Streptomyces sp. CBMA152 TaxID=1896312 RepID=UPI0016603184|nr:FtsQ-type POTRA domain-containing protein [Streptomyces sp. CBMA152]MBD0743286.1 cell division protein FtsQ [Streptomyces sp. CBMA152]